MLFTKTAHVIAWLLVVLGLLQVAMGLGIAYWGDPDMLHRYSSAQTTGEVIDNGLRRFFVGIVLGVLTEIGTGVAAKTIDARTSPRPVPTRE